MEIRRIRPEEFVQRNQLWTIVYNGRHDYVQPDPEDLLDEPAEWTWASFEKGKILSCMNEIPFLMRFDGNSVKMSGIGGVGTLPEARMGGHVRKIFEKLLPAAYENGVIFSNLNPFSHVFYRKFGYEVACARNEIQMSTQEFLHIKMPGTFSQIFPGDDTADLESIHNIYISDLNHGIHRNYLPENRAWKKFARDDPYKTGNFIYLWKDESGRPKSYIKYRHEKENDKNIMLVREIAFVDKDSLYGILSLISGLRSQYQILKWPMPTFLDPVDFARDLWDLEQHIIPRDMSRIINVKAALELMRRPAGEGSFVLDVVDTQIPANTGRFFIGYGPEGNHVSLTQKDPDLRCDIPVLTQLVLGYRTLETMLFSKKTGLEVAGNREILDKVFTLRPQHITEYF
ncbi:GNAT family acetyltransferase [Spirochaetia bacterium]|nr:GNAT family acetyltransferase [Spirochaetia bacterium]